MLTNVLSYRHLLMILPTQCCGSGSALILVGWIRICTDPDPGGHKCPIKTEKVKKYHVFLSTGCSLLMTEGFSCSLDVFYGGLIAFFLFRRRKKFRQYYFFQFWSSNPWIRIRRIRIHMKCWIQSGFNESRSTTLDLSLFLEAFRHA